MDGIPVKSSVLNANDWAYRWLSGLIEIRRPIEPGPYLPRLFSGLAYSQAKQLPSPFGITVHTMRAILEEIWKV